MEYDRAFIIVMAISVTVLGPLIFFGVGIWILRPIDQAGRQRQLSSRFTLADFFCLFFTVQLPMSLIAWLRSEELAEFLWAMTILTWVVAPCIWWTAARATSRAGISHGWPRIILIGLVVPVVYYGLVPFIVSVAICLSTIASGGGDQLLVQYRWPTALAILLGCGLIVCGMATRHIVKSVESRLDAVNPQ